MENNNISVTVHGRHQPVNDNSNMISNITNRNNSANIINTNSNSALNNIYSNMNNINNANGSNLLNNMPVMQIGNFSSHQATFDQGGQYYNRS